MQYGFGVGSLYGVNTAANSTPRQFGALQDISLDISYSMKELYGAGQFPLSIARGKGKITGKAKIGNLDPAMFNDIFFGQSISSGMTQASANEAATVPALTPFTCTVANSATFVQDLGVVYVGGGALTKVASGPTAGQYSVAAGVYTFAAADTGKAVLISYTYTVAATGQQITLANKALGTTPYFKVVLSETFGVKIMTVTLNQCASSKLALPLKQEDYAISELDFTAMDDGTGTVGTFSLNG